MLRLQRKVRWTDDGGPLKIQLRVGQPRTDSSRPMPTVTTAILDEIRRDGFNVGTAMIPMTITSSTSEKPGFRTLRVVTNASPDSPPSVRLAIGLRCFNVELARAKKERVERTFL